MKIMAKALILLSLLTLTGCYEDLMYLGEEVKSVRHIEEVKHIRNLNFVEERAIVTNEK